MADLRKTPYGDCIILDEYGLVGTLKEDLNYVRTSFNQIPCKDSLNYFVFGMHQSFLENGKMVSILKHKNPFDFSKSILSKNWYKELDDKTTITLTPDEVDFLNEEYFYTQFDKVILNCKSKLDSFLFKYNSHHPSTIKKFLEELTFRFSLKIMDIESEDPYNVLGNGIDWSLFEDYVINSSKRLLWHLENCLNTANKIIHNQVVAEKGDFHVFTNTVFGSNFNYMIKLYEHLKPSFMDDSLLADEFYQKLVLPKIVANTTKINLKSNTLNDHAYLMIQLKPFFTEHFKQENSSVYNEWWSDNFLFNSTEKLPNAISKMVSNFTKEDKQPTIKNTIDEIVKDFKATCS